MVNFRGAPGIVFGQWRDWREDGDDTTPRRHDAVRRALAPCQFRVAHRFSSGLSRARW